MATPTYKVRAGWLTGDWTEISSSYSWAQLADGFRWEELVAGAVPDADVEQISISRQASNINARLTTGQARIQLDNSRGQYTGNPSAIRINDIVGVWALSGSSVYGLYSGYADRFDVSPALHDGRKLTVQAADIASRLRPVISTSLYVNPTQSTVFQAILSAASIPADRYVLDQHNELLQFAYLDQVTAGDAIAEVQQNGAQYIYVDGRGRLQIKNRNFDVPSLSGFGPYSQIFALSQSLDDQSVVNRVQVTTTPRDTLINLSTVGWISDPVFIAAAGSVDFIIDFIDPITNERGAPVQNIQSMVSGTDFYFSANVDGGGTNQTACLSLQVTPNATSARIQAANVGSGANNGYLTICQVKGYAVSRQPDLTQTVRDDASIAIYQERFQSVTASMLGTKNRAMDLGEFLLVTGSTPKAQTTLSLKNEFPDVVQVDLLARLAITNSTMAIGSSFIVQGIEHSLSFDGGTEHTLTLDCELALIKDYFVLDSNVLGHLDINKLGF